MRANRKYSEKEIAAIFEQAAEAQKAVNRTLQGAPIEQTVESLLDLDDSHSTESEAHESMVARRTRSRS